MASIARGHEFGEAVDLGRDNWLSHEAVALLQRACDDPQIGGPKMLAVLLHDGLGTPLSLIGRLTGRTKNQVKTQVITARKRLRANEERWRNNPGGQGDVKCRQ